MRTTLNISDDVLFAAKEQAQRQRRSVGEILSELARQGLLSNSRAGEVAESGSFYGFEPLPRRGPAVSNQLIDHILEEESD